MNTNHTSGNLKAIEFGIYDEEGPIGTTFVSTKDRYIGEEEARANAKLFAQSPNMLYILNDIVQCESLLLPQLPEGFVKEQLKAIIANSKEAIGKATK